MSNYALAMPDGSTIPYKLERRQRRSVGMRISPNGLIVHAPTRIKLSQLEQILLSKADWISKKLQDLQQHMPAPFHWEDGAELLLLGNPLALAVQHDPRSRAVQHTPGLLNVSLPTPEDEAAIARKVIQWYRKEALGDFGRRLQILAARLGIPTPTLFLSSARARWGSCNSKREVRLNWRLIQAPPHIINYVICHELAHIKEMNHSPKFWAVVESICPNYKRAEKDLNTLSARLHQLD